jgi:hypothetical protein
MLLSKFRSIRSLDAMMPPINIGRRQPVSLRGVGAAKGGSAGAAAAAMTQVAGRMAQAMAQELGLADIDPRERYTGGTASDAYGVEEMAAELSEALGGGPADKGHVARALHDFVREGAVLIAARPESRSLERLERAITSAANKPQDRGSDVEHAISAIDQAALRLQEAGPPKTERA